jgi:FkbM family methyltransferase
MPVTALPLYDILNHVRNRLGAINIVQIGAFVGNSMNDPLFRFLKENCAGQGRPGICRAILVEPVRSYFTELTRNYIDCLGSVHLENVALAEEMGFRKFYKLRSGVNPRAYNMPDFTRQLGSLLENRITELWDHYEKNPEIRKFLMENTDHEYVIAITYEQLLKKHQMTDVDFLQIDAEGYDFEMIKTIDLKNSAPKTVNYEHVLLRDDEEACRAFLRQHGYKVLRHGINTIAVATEHAEALGINLIED